jgi:hypothetical protein
VIPMGNIAPLVLPPSPPANTLDDEDAP